MSNDALISNLCDIILTDNDEINRDEAKKYIDDLTEEDISKLEDEKSQNLKFLHALLLKKVADYIERYKLPNSTGAPFEFDSSGSFSVFVDFFVNTYEKSKDKIFPLILNNVFEYIQNMSDHYRIFEKFYAVRSTETSAVILSNARNQAEEAVIKGINKTLDSALRETTEKIKENANLAEHQAHQAYIQAEVAKEQARNANKDAEAAAKSAVNSAVDNKMNEVSIKITEHSVTILGIFAGIVLTVVAGLFYSSSVLENINSANFFRLISIASLVGLVCYHLIALMFRYIERIKNSNIAVSKISDLDKWISLVLIIIITFFGFLQFIFPEKNKSNVKDTTTSIYAKVDVDTKQGTISSESRQDDEISALEQQVTNAENLSSEATTNSN